MKPEPDLTLSEFRQCGIVAGMRDTETVLSAVQRVVAERDQCLASLRELAFEEFGQNLSNENKTTETT